MYKVLKCDPSKYAIVIIVLERLSTASVVKTILSRHLLLYGFAHTSTLYSNESQKQHAVYCIHNTDVCWVQRIQIFYLKGEKVVEG